jgi:hypothetical protein
MSISDILSPCITSSLTVLLSANSDFIKLFSLYVAEATARERTAAFFYGRTVTIFE